MRGGKEARGRERTVRLDTIAATAALAATRPRETPRQSKSKRMIEQENDRGG